MRMFRSSYSSENVQASVLIENRAVAGFEKVRLENK